DKGDAAHAKSIAAITAARNRHERLLIPALVLCESAYMLESQGLRVAVAAIVQDILAGGYQLEPPTPDDLERALDIETTYQVGLTDSTVAALAERINCRIATLDRRHFAKL